MDSKMDRRTKSRVDLKLSCRIDGAPQLSDNSLDRSEKTATEKETTENISRNGLLLRWTRPTPAPVAGSAMRVEVELPSDGDFAPRLMRCESTVVRIIPGDKGLSHVALKVHTMSFIEDHARAVSPAKVRVN
jgi:hypothetical protein